MPLNNEDSNRIREIALLIASQIEVNGINPISRSGLYDWAATFEARTIQITATCWCSYCSNGRQLLTDIIEAWQTLRNSYGMPPDPIVAGPRNLPSSLDSFLHQITQERDGSAAPSENTTPSSQPTSRGISGMGDTPSLAQWEEQYRQMWSGEQAPGQRITIPRVTPRDTQRQVYETDMLAEARTMSSLRRRPGFRPGPSTLSRLDTAGLTEGEGTPVTIGRLRETRSNEPE